MMISRWPAMLRVWCLTSRKLFHEPNTRYLSTVCFERKIFSILLQHHIKFYSSCTTPKITSEEYNKFKNKQVLRFLDKRTCITSTLTEHANKNVIILGWIEHCYNGGIFLCDGYGKISCYAGEENTKIRENMLNLKSQDLIAVNGTVIVGSEKETNIRILDFKLISSRDGNKNAKPNTYTERTHTCGELSINSIGERVILCGWLQYLRMNRFLLLRDSYGMTQCVASDNLDLSNLPMESVIKITGTVSARPAEMINHNMSTGEIEVVINNLELLNEVEDIPFTIRTHQKPKEQLRLQHRYIDMRYPEMQNNLRLRSMMLHQMRKFLIEGHSFVEVETPTLFCRTPGGAREFVVPTHHPGLFYSLVQSPQQFKQMLMVGGVDRYFQVARCYRDESTRPDRQPEFTQLDIELSFTSLAEVIKLIEDLLYETYPIAISRPPFKILTYREALETYGSDKPDMSYDLKLNNITSCLENINGINDVGSYAIVLSHEMKKLTTKTKEAIKAARKRYPRVQILDYNKISGNSQRNISSKLQLNDSNAVYIASGENDDTCLLLGEIRILLSQEMQAKGLLKVKNGTCEPCWIVDFPLFKRGVNSELETCHHPFTAPHPEDIHLLDSDPLKVRSLAYDLVMNGNEVGGGSVRAHNPHVQIKLLNMLNIDLSAMEHFIKALKSGCPPHAGIALGIDRMMALACNTDSIRDVIAFPKSHEGKDPLSGAPNCISTDDQNYYNLEVKVKDEHNNKVIV